MIGTINLLSYENLIYKIISPYTRYFDIDDLYQVGMLALVKASKNYRENKNAEFSSYAYLYVKGEVCEFMRKSNYFKVSKDMASINKKIEETRSLLTQKLKREPSEEEIALFLKIPIETIQEIKERTSLVESLDSSPNDPEQSYYDYQKYTEPNYKEELLDLKFALEELSKPEQRLIYERYINGFTQSEVSKELGISQVQVSRKEKEIFTRLRTRLR